MWVISHRQATLKLASISTRHMTLKWLLSWLTQQLRHSTSMHKHSMWGSPPQPRCHHHPAIMPGRFLVWEPFLPLSCRLWSAGFRSLLSGSAFLVGLCGTGGSLRQLLRSQQLSRPTLRALPWYCILTVQRAWSGSTCAGARCAFMSGYFSILSAFPKCRHRSIIITHHTAGSTLQHI